MSDDPSLAFANTLTWRGSDKPAEAFSKPTDLFDWLGAARLLGEAEVKEILHRARDDAAYAMRFLAETIALREAIYRLLSTLASGKPGDAPDLATLNDALARTPARNRLGRLADGYAWHVHRPGLTVPAVLAPVLWSAADLLVAGERRRVRQCANEACLWLFIDRSRSGKRRWCDMASCGNRAKARRHYLKTRQA